MISIQSILSKIPVESRCLFSCRCSQARSEICSVGQGPAHLIFTASREKHKRADGGRTSARLQPLTCSSALAGDETTQVGPADCQLSPMSGALQRPHHAGGAEPEGERPRPLPPDCPKRSRKVGDDECLTASSGSIDSHNRTSRQTLEVNREVLLVPHSQR